MAKIWWGVLIILLLIIFFFILLGSANKDFGHKILNLTYYYSGWKYVPPGSSSYIPYYLRTADNGQTSVGLYRSVGYYNKFDIFPTTAKILDANSIEFTLQNNNPNYPVASPWTVTYLDDQHLQVNYGGQTYNLQRL